MTMFRTVTVVDNALRDPHGVRLSALRQEFGPREYKGHVYEGIATAFALPADQLLSAATGRRVRTELQFWRLGLDADDTTTFIHADNVAAEWAAILYLSEPGAPMAGTAFWDHQEFGEALSPELSPEQYERINAAGHDESQWTMCGLIGQRFNRLAVYPTFLFHSRYPRRAWGDSPETGRLTWISFFNDAVSEEG